MVLRYAIFNWLLIKFRKVEYQEYPKISGKLFITGRGKLKLGKNIRLNSGITSNPIGGDSRIVISVAENAVLEIGDNCGISNSAIICNEKIILGNNIYLGGGVKIYDSDFHSLNVSERTGSKKSDIPVKAPVFIENGCFIGAHSIILKGVTIGEGSIIGAGSVVAKSIPSGEIWGGNPAKFIKKLD